MAAKKCQRVAEQDYVFEEPSIIVSFENSLNTEKGFLRLPIELQDEVLHYFQGVNIYQNGLYDSNSITQIPGIYRYSSCSITSLRRVPSSFLAVFVGVFHGLHWLQIGSKSIVILCTRRGNSDTKMWWTLKKPRPSSPSKVRAFLLQSTGLTRLRRVHVVITWYNSATIVPKFASLLQQLPNLHTLHILHAHTLVLKALMEGFYGVHLPQIRTLVVSGYCHEIVKCCPGATKIWCIREDDRELIAAVAKGCKEVEELRGFRPNENLMKSKEYRLIYGNRGWCSNPEIVKNVPGLRVYEILDGYEDVWYPSLCDFAHTNAVVSQVLLNYISSFKKLDTVILRPYKVVWKAPLVVREATISKCVAALKSLPPGPIKRRLFISREGFTTKADESQLTGDLSEVYFS